MATVKDEKLYSGKGKGIPITGHEVHIFTATALGRGRVASPTLGRLYPRGKPPVLML